MGSPRLIGDRDPFSDGWGDLFVSVSDKGDGTGDITDALLSISGDGLIPVVPAGNYTVSAEIENLTGLVGAGIDQTIITVAANTLVADAESYLLQPAIGCELSGFTLDGNRTGNANKRGTGIGVLGSVSNVLIRNIRIKSFGSFVSGQDPYGGDGIYIATSGSNIRTEGLIADDIMRCAWTAVSGTNIVLRDARITDGGVFGIDIENHNDSEVLVGVTLDNVHVENIGAINPGISNYGIGISVSGRENGVNYITGLRCINITSKSNRLWGLRTIGCMAPQLTNLHIHSNSTATAGLWPNLNISNYTVAPLIQGAMLRPTPTTTDNASYSLLIDNQASITAVNAYGMAMVNYSDAGFKLLNLTRAGVGMLNSNASNAAILGNTGAGVGHVSWSQPSGNVLDDGVVNLTTVLPTTRAILTLTKTAGRHGMVELAGNATFIIWSGGGLYTTTKDNPGTINVYFDAGAYRLQNRSGGTVFFNLAGTGL